MNGYSGFWFEQESMVSVIFEREGVQFLFCCTIGKDEFLKIASGIIE